MQVRECRCVSQLKTWSEPNLPAHPMNDVQSHIMSSNVQSTICHGIATIVHADQCQQQLGLFSTVSRRVNKIPRQHERNEDKVVSRDNMSLQCSSCQYRICASHVPASTTACPTVKPTAKQSISIYSTKHRNTTR